jgi:hypothetical protein
MNVIKSPLSPGGYQDTFLPSGVLLEGSSQRKVNYNNYYSGRHTEGEFPVSN